MKNIKILLAAIIFVSSFNACDFTDLDPTDMVGEEVAFKDVDGVYKATIGAYAKMSLQRTLAIVEYIADDVKQGGQAGGAGTDLAAWTYAASSSEASSYWLNNYSLINQCNRVLDFGPNVTPANAEEAATLDDCLGTAYFFRAYAHFELLRVYADFKDENKPGIPYVSHYHILGTPARDKVGECYDQLMLDLERAYNMIAADAPADKTFVSKVAVNALRARISLYRKKYTHAYVYAQDVLSKVPMAAKDKVADVWIDQSADGIIFLLPRKSGQTRIGGTFVGTDHSSVFAPTTPYMGSYTDTDVRKPVFFKKGPDREGSTVDVVNKWYGSEANIGLCEEKIFRSEEMKLIEAEALLGMNRADDASDALNDLRIIRIDGWVSQTYTAAQLPDEILLERRRELAFEGHRFFDLRRAGKDIVRDGKTLEAADYRMLLPIPKGELDANPNIPQAGGQNPGY